MHQAAVFRFAMLMTGDAAKAAEVTQDVFYAGPIRINARHPTPDPARGELGSFLAGVTRKFLQRRRGEELRWVQLDESTLTASENDRRETEDAADATAHSEALGRAILALPEKYREVVVRCDLEEKSYEDAAGVIGCAVGTVRSRLHRARALLARKLQPKAERTTERCPA